MKNQDSAKLGELFKGAIDKKIEEISNTSIWNEKPVPPKTFFNEWMKSPLFPIQQEAVDNILVEERDGELHWSTKYNEAYLLYGEGSGKDFTVSRMWTYTVYYLLCLKNPQAYFNLGIDTEPIDLVNVSFDEDQALSVFFKKFKSCLTSTINPTTGKKWFEEKGMKIRETSKIQAIEFPKHITAYSLNSKEYKAEGKNVLMAVFDEMAVFKVDKAKELFNNLKGSMKSRFPNHHKFIAISYKRDDYDYMMVRWDETKNDKRAYRSGPFATWDVNLLRKKEDFADEYIRNPEDAERRYECKGNTIKEGYFKYKEKIRESINKSRKSPILEEVIPLRKINDIRFADWFKGVAGVGYGIHIDLAKGKETDNERPDCAGFVLGHLEPNLTDEELPILYVDLLCQIAAETKGKEIIFEDVRKLIYKLVNLGFNIEKVTLDGFNSIDFMQILNNKGIKAELLSVDRDIGPYDTTKSLIYQKRIDWYGYPVAIRELEELQERGGKVDHPEISRRRALEENGNDKGSKDVSDSLAGLSAQLLEYKVNKPKSKWVPLEGEGKYKENSNTKDPNARDYGENYKVNTEDEDDE